MTLASMSRRPRPRRHTRPHAHPLVREFLGLLEAEGVSITDVADRAGLGRATLIKWKYRHAPTVVALEAALNVLGYRLAILLQKNDPSRAATHTRVRAGLMPRERG